MKKAMVWISSIIFVLSCGGSLIWEFWWYPKTYEYALQLADDSSLPQTKAEYLKEYLGNIESIKGQPAYIFMRPDLKLDKQRDILKGLIQRFDDIAKIEPSNMAYQQGMEQLTGQEIDHQLDRVSGIFRSAKLRESTLLFFLICWLPILSVLFPIFVGIKILEVY